MSECAPKILEENILSSIKHLLGILPDVDIWDKDISLLINGVCSHLNQIGVFKSDMPFVLISGKETWTDFFLATEDGKTDIDLGTIQNVKTFIYIKVKLIFDPPSNAAILKAYEAEAKEIEYRLYTQKGGF